MAIQSTGGRQVWQSIPLGEVRQGDGGKTIQILCESGGFSEGLATALKRDDASESETAAREATNVVTLSALQRPSTGSQVINRSSRTRPAPTSLADFLRNPEVLRC